MRQSLRNLSLLINLLLLPVIVFYISPIIPMMAAEEGVLNGSLIVFGLIFITSLFIGRSFCGWVCGFGSLQESCSNVNSRKATGGIFSYIKYLLWIPWFSSIIAGFVTLGGIKTINFFYYTTKGISVVSPDVYIIFYSILFMIATISLLFGKRAFCHYVCVIALFNIIGTKIQQLLKLPGLRLKAVKAKCTSCEECSNACIKGLDVAQLVKNKTMYHHECILCGVCVDTCKQKAIRFSL